MDSSLEAETLKKILADVSEMYVETLGKPPQVYTDRYISRFLLVKLNIDVVLQEITIYRRRQKLSSTTDGSGLARLGAAYSTTLGRIKRQGAEEKARLVMAALIWISHAERPLKAAELCHALAVFHGPVNPLYPSRIPPSLPRPFRRSSLDNRRNLLDLLEFPASRGLFN